MFRTTLFAAVLAGVTLPVCAQSAPIATRTKAAPQRSAAPAAPESQGRADVSRELAQVRRELAQLTAAIDRLAKALEEPGAPQARSPRAPGAIGRLAVPERPGIALAPQPGALRMPRAFVLEGGRLATPVAPAEPAAPQARVRSRVVAPCECRCAPARAAVQGGRTIEVVAPQPPAPPARVRVEAPAPPEPPAVDEGSRILRVKRIETGTRDDGNRKKKLISV